MNTIETRHSPLFNLHRKLQADFTSLGTWKVPLHYGRPEKAYQTVHSGVGLGDLSPRVKLSLQGDAGQQLMQDLFGQAPETVGDAVWLERLPSDLQGSLSHVALAQLTSDEVFILAPPDAEPPLLHYLTPALDDSPELLTLTDQTAAYCGLLLAGPRSRDVLSKLCALPLDDSSFPPLHTAQTSLAKTRAILLRRDVGQIPTFEIFSDYSYAAYLWRAIMDAGQEWHITPFGWQTYTNLSRKI